MIESRYKIEYVLPDEDVKKTSPFRVLWYLLLIPLVLLAVAAITYDFSWNNISRDSLILVEKAKVHIFNLGETQDPKKLEKKINTVVETSITPKPSTPQIVIKKVIEKPIASRTPATPKPLINEDKIIITELTAKQELQLKTIQAQIAKNTELTQDLEKLSEQLVLEQIKNQELNSQIAEEEKDRTELEEQLNQILEDSVDKEVSAKKSTIQDNKEDPVAVEPKITESEETVQNKPAEVVQNITQEVSQEPVKEEKTEQSETDKIIEAMTSIASEKNKNIEAEAKAVSEPEVAAKPDIPTKSKETSSDSTITSNEEPEENKDLSPISKPIVVIKETETATVKDEIEITEIKTEVSNNSETEEKVDTNVQAPKKRSAVDDIIAAMQDSQSNSTNSNPETKQAIDSKSVEKVKQQLIGKGELSVDN